MTLLNKLHLCERSGTHHTLSTISIQHVEWHQNFSIEHKMIRFLFPELAAELYPLVAFGTTNCLFALHRSYVKYTGL